MSTSLARYRCAVETEVPVTLENVTSEQRPMFFVASQNAIAWSMLAVAGMALYGHARANNLEGKTLTVPAGGEATLTDDRIVLRVMIPSKVSGVSLRGDASTRSINLEIPYRAIQSWGKDYRNVRLDIIGRGPMWLLPRDKGEFQQWLAHLSHNKTWQPPTPVQIQAQVPIVSWCQQDPHFTFGLPERWNQGPSAFLADYARGFLPSIVRAAVGLDAGRWEVQVFVIDDGSLQARGRPANTESLAAMLAEATNISPIGPVQLARLGGEPLLLLRGTSWTAEGLVDRCYGSIAHGDTHYMLWFNIVDAQVGDGSYETWLPHFHTMIATWHWYQ
jgi:hypothetical protein